MQIAALLQAVAGAPSFPSLEGWKFLTSLLLGAVTAATPIALNSSIGLSQPIPPIALPAHISDRHFMRSENTPIHQKTKDKCNFLSTVFWLGSKTIFSLAPAISDRNTQSRVAISAQKRRADSEFPFLIFNFPASTGSALLVPEIVLSGLILPRSATVGCTSRSGPSATPIQS